MVILLVSLGDSSGQFERMQMLVRCRSRPCLLLLKKLRNKILCSMFAVVADANNCALELDFFFVRLYMLYIQGDIF